MKKGKVDILVIDKYIRILNEKEYFDGRALFFHEKCSASIKANDNNMKEHLINRLYLQDESVQLKDLYFVENLGNGNYGNVSLVNN